jgi:hypothetical protein
LFIPVKVGINYTCLVFLVSRVEHFQHIFANELIISVHINHNGVLTAVVMSGHVDILESSPPFIVLDVDIVFLFDVVEVEILSEELIGSVSRGIVHNYDEVIGVILGKDRVEVVLKSETGVVIVTRNHDAHRYLLRNFVELKNGFYFGVFLGLLAFLFIIMDQVNL